jgi:hypothetical protein
VRLFSVTMRTTFSGASAAISALISSVTLTEAPASPPPWPKGTILTR